MVELLPCPCCGGETSMQEDHWRDGTLRGGEPFCRKCGLKMPRFWPRRKSDAITAWNTRASESPSPPGAAMKRIAELEAKVAALKAAGRALAEALSSFARAEFIMGQHDGTGKMEAVLRYSDTQPETFTLASIKEARTALAAWSTANGH